MDGIVLLREDHRTVEKLFQEFERADDDAHPRRRELADDVIGELTAHAWIEERKSAPDDPLEVPSADE
ncbi:hypothetical protein [Streptomyces globisporus]|uniref:hypothetical protein n=1 Tax=Streptomyces globisporus TaxID=1908 RepID=UPI0004CB3AB6|nr:hypothetical protein [Streptomyces globisporus]